VTPALFEVTRAECFVERIEPVSFGTDHVVYIDLYGALLRKGSSLVPQEGACPIPPILKIVSGS
jgi:hypothetical protein